jgi:hypothetical protein
MSHWARAPFIKIGRALEKRKERRLERCYNLPEGYLAGIQLRCPRSGSCKDLAQAKASEYHYKKLQHEIQVSLDRFVPTAIELFMRHHQVQFALEFTDVDKDKVYDTTYQHMSARYDKLPTHKGPRRIPTPGPGSIASAPPLFHEVQIHGVPGGNL